MSTAERIVTARIWEVYRSILVLPVLLPSPTWTRVNSLTNDAILYGTLPGLRTKALDSDSANVVMRTGVRTPHPPAPSKSTAEDVIGEAGFGASHEVSLSTLLQMKRAGDRCWVQVKAVIIRCYIALVSSLFFYKCSMIFFCKFNDCFNGCWIERRQKVFWIVLGIWLLVSGTWLQRESSSDDSRVDRIACAGSPSSSRLFLRMVQWRDG